MPGIFGIYPEGTYIAEHGMEAFTLIPGDTIPGPSLVGRGLQRNIIDIQIVIVQWIHQDLVEGVSRLAPHIDGVMVHLNPAFACICTAVYLTPNQPVEIWIT